MTREKKISAPTMIISVAVFIAIAFFPKTNCIIRIVRRKKKGLTERLSSALAQSRSAFAWGDCSWQSAWLASQRSAFRRVHVEIRDRIPIAVLRQACVLVSAG